MIKNVQKSINRKKNTVKNNNFLFFLHIIKNFY